MCSQPDTPLTSSITADAVNAPIFVPKLAMSLGSGRSSPAVATDSPRPFALPVTSSAPSLASHYEQQREAAIHAEYDNTVYDTDAPMDSQYYVDHQYNGYTQDYSQDFSQNGDTSFFGPTSQVFASEPLNYHLYSSSLPASVVASSADTHFVPHSDELRQTLQEKSAAIRMVPATPLNMPEDLQGYHTVVPLDTIGPSERRKFGNWYSSEYRAVNSNDGTTYLLQRVENFRLTHSTALSPVETWSKIRHPSIAQLCEAFTTRAFGDNSLVMVYEFQPKAQSLYDLYVKSSSPTFNQRSQMLVQGAPTAIPLRTLWSFIIQIAMAIKKVHENGLALRTIDASKILVTSKNRIHIACCGILDVLMFDSRQDLVHLQLEDLTHFGRLIFALCCNNLSAAVGPNFQKSLDHIHRNYGVEVKNLALFLISKPAPHKTVQVLFEMILPHLCDEVDESLGAVDRLEHELMSELENARLVRLLCKFGFINERPEFARDPRWSETGDRYIIKLFRDYVFHQVNEHGNPVTDLTHVLTCLNKLDAGTNEKLMLVSRDEQSCLVVSYKEIKACIESAFNELAHTSNANNTAILHGYRG